jgi:hypothetical protein
LAPAPVLEPVFWSPVRLAPWPAASSVAFSVGRFGVRRLAAGIAGPTITSIGIAGHTRKQIVAAHNPLTGAVRA